jgi:hypothetical protein
MSKYEIELDADGDTVRISMDGRELKKMPGMQGPPGTLPGPRLGKLYSFEGNPSLRYCVKRFGKWW